MINWNDLTPEEKRVEIAKDVIESLKTNVYWAKRGLYIGYSIYNMFPVEASLQDVLLNGNVRACDVCALGACFLSLIKHENDFTVGNLENTNFNSVSIFRERLEQVFSKEQLGIIESVFETFYIHAVTGGNNFETAKIAENWFWEKHRFVKYHDADEKLTIIMQNIIDNNGTFILD